MEIKVSYVQARRFIDFIHQSWIVTQKQEKSCLWQAQGD